MTRTRREAAEFREHYCTISKWHRHKNIKFKKLFWWGGIIFSLTLREGAHYCTISKCHWQEDRNWNISLYYIFISICICTYLELYLYLYLIRYLWIKVSPMSQGSFSPRLVAWLARLINFPQLCSPHRNIKLPYCKNIICKKYTNPAQQTYINIIEVKEMWNEKLEIQW